MTDIEICHRDTLYVTPTLELRRHPARWPIDREPGLAEDFAMTIELFYLTAQIQRWLNQRVARHLAAQAERLTR
jgi:hypothetical protein